MRRERAAVALMAVFLLATVGLGTLLPSGGGGVHGVTAIPHLGLRPHVGNQASSILVRTRPGRPAHLVAQRHGQSAPDAHDSLGISVVPLTPGADVAAAVRIYSADPDVLYAEPNPAAETAVTPGDPLYPQQWGWPDLNGPAAWDSSVGSSSVVVAIIDTGVDGTHPDLQGRVLAGVAAVDSNGSGYTALPIAAGAASDDNGHGTHVAGIVAAGGQNGRGGVGTCWSCRILPVKVFDSSGTGYMDGVVYGIEWAADQGARVINMSLTGGASQSLNDAVAYAWAKGVVVVAAAGNDGSTNVAYPAGCPHAIGVGAVDSSNTVASFSQKSSAVKLVAPGVSVLSTYAQATSSGQPYTYMDGTSMATPHVSGLAALMLSVNPGLNPDQVLAAMESTARPLGGSSPNNSYGYGLIDDRAAVIASGGSAAPAPSPSPASQPTPSPSAAPVGGGPQAALPTGFVLDGWGGVHPFGSSPSVNTSAYWPGWRIARGLAVNGAGGQVLDGFGGLHPFGGAPAVAPGGYWPGWDIARGVALVPGHSDMGYVLDGWGGIHPFGGAPAVATSGYWPGWDIARAIVLNPGVSGASISGYVLDGWGSLHPFWDAAHPGIGTPALSGYWPGWDIARGVVATGQGQGYVLDGWGGLHPFGGAPTLTPGAYWPGWNIARAVTWSPGLNGGYVVDGFGGLHPFGAAPGIPTQAYWPGWDIAAGAGS